MEKIRIFLSGRNPSCVLGLFKEALGVSGFYVNLPLVLLTFFSSEQGLAHGHEIMNYNNLCTRYLLLSSHFLTGPFLTSPRASEG